jgi:TPR repeat protein
VSGIAAGPPKVRELKATIRGSVLSRRSRFHAGAKTCYVSAAKHGGGQARTSMASALCSVGMLRQSALRVFLACTLFSLCSACAQPGRFTGNNTYNPNLDHVMFERLQQVRTDEANGNNQQALGELLQIDAEGDFPRPVGRDLPPSLGGNPRDWNRRRIWQDHQNQLAWAREMIGDIYAEGRVGAQDLPQAIAWYQKAINTNGAGLSTESLKFKLAFMYENGLGMPKSHAQAEAILNSTAARQTEAEIRREEREHQMWASVMYFAFTHPGSSTSSTSTESSEPTWGECLRSGNFAGMKGYPPWKWP